MDELRVEVVDSSSPAWRRALARYFAELDERFATGFEPADPSERGEGAASGDPATGVFVVACVGADVVGCGAVHVLEADTAEIRRMWVDPTRRRTGVASRVLERLEAYAREFGCRRVVLDTNATLTEAVALYERRGYGRIPRYNDNPYAQVWFAKVLDAPL